MINKDINYFQTAFMFLIKDLFPNISSQILMVLNSNFFISKNRTLPFEFKSNNEEFLLTFIHEENLFKMTFENYSFVVELAQSSFKIKIDNYVITGIILSTNIDNGDIYHVTTVFNSETKKAFHLNKTIKTQIFYRIIFDTDSIPLEPKLFDIITY